MTTKIQIANVKEEKKYAGAYARIFSILNKDSIFGEVCETDESIGLVDNTYHLEIEGTLDCEEETLISSLKNVKIID